MFLFSQETHFSLVEYPLLLLEGYGYYAKITDFFYDFQHLQFFYIIYKRHIIYLNDPLHES